MANRREFLQIGIAASTLSITAQAKGVSAITEESRQHISFYKTIFDKRYSDSVKFSDQMRKQQVAVHGITGDITPFWFHELDALWRKEPVAVAGMTAHGPLFCLEQLAHERGMRVVYRSQHQLNHDGIIEHQLAGPQDMLDKSKSGELSLASLDNDWSAGIAKLMVECPTGHTALDEIKITAPVSSLAANADEIDVIADPLISWIIAPARKA